MTEDVIKKLWFKQWKYSNICSHCLLNSALFLEYQFNHGAHILIFIHLPYPYPDRNDDDDDEGDEWTSADHRKHRK